MSDEKTTAYAQFERAALLEAQVRNRTVDLERALDLLNDSNAKLADANLAIEAARNNLDDALESMDDGFALFDRDENLLLFNSRFCMDFPDVRETLNQGMAFKEFVARISRSVFLDLPENTTSLAWERRRLAQHLEQRVVFNIGLIDDRWLQIGEHRTKHGGTVILQTDVTDIMRHQRNERETLIDNQSKMLRATLDHLEQGICIFDHRSRLVGWNQKLESMMQIAVPRVRVLMHFDKIIDLLCAQMTFGNGTNEAWLKAWANRSGARDPVSFELSDEGGIIYGVFAQEMPDHGFVISFTDVTIKHKSEAALRDMNKTLEQRVAARTEELGAALEEAKRANESKSRFVAAASHDLLQPLSAAKLFAASLLENDPNGSTTHISRKVVSALTSVEDIIEALLDISKLDVGQATFDVQDVSLHELFSSLASELAPAADAKNLSLRVVDTDAWVISDPVFLRRIMQNLMTNAIRYTDKGRVLVGIRREGKHKLRLEVHDTGPGILPQDQNKIFKEFSRLTPSRSVGEGLGLGLAIVDRACKSLDHSLSLHSIPGKGSCFSVTVEASAVCISMPPPSVEEWRDRSPLNGKVLLVVENDEALAHAIEIQLEGWGAHVIGAHSGEMALELLDEIDLIPDAMVLDHQLETGMTGLQLRCMITGRFGDVPSLIISASRSAELKLGCEILGLPLLSKPLDPKKLLETLQVLCCPAALQI
ncbi:MAG: PAS-domain containing protein [Pseudomonadota bacterium]